MKGLLVKDALLIKNQYRTLPLLLACGLIMSFSMEAFTAMIYVAIVGTMMSLGTIAYDEFDHGYIYLLSLPVDRKTYVREKYLFSLAVGGICIFMGLAMDTVVTLVKNALPLGSAGEIAGALCGTAAVMLIMLSVTIPARLKFGSEKSSIVLFAFAGLIVALFAAFRYGKFFPASWGEKFMKLSQTGHTGVLTAAALAAAVLVLILSEQLSERIMAKKEF
ncbi:MAG: ABC-2 transporter permease [Lachnospiraceae bacterium]|nr:ABC-2 transporter permease [Lachnospiraceae bacterium]